FIAGTATPDAYTLSLHDALPIFLLVKEDVARGGVAVLSVHGDPRNVEVRLRDEAVCAPGRGGAAFAWGCEIVADRPRVRGFQARDRKSTRLNSSHLVTSYAVSCL